MKKLLFICFLGILLFTGCSSKGYEEINFSTLNDKVRNKESFILFIGAESCTHCDDYKRTLKSIKEDYEDIVFHYIDIDKLSVEQKKELTNIVNYNGTPTTVFFKDGVEDGKSGYNRISGSMDYEYVIQKLKQNGYIESK